MKKFSFFFLVFVFLYLFGEKRTGVFSTNDGFIENKGQWSSEVLFMGKTKDARVWILRNGIGFDYYNAADSIFKRIVFSWKNSLNPEIKSFGKKQGFFNFITSSQRIAGINIFSDVILKNLYPGIDVHYYFDRGYLRFDLIVESNANLENVILSFPEGVKAIINEAGEIQIDLVDRKIYISYPVSYVQNTNSNLTSSFILIDKELKFHVEKPENLSGKIIIDPLIYSTYLGGNQLDYATSMFVDSAGNAYLTGYTKSTDFDITSGAYQTSLTGQYDIFVTKINPFTNSLIYSTFIGGSGNDFSFDIAINSNGEAFLVGYTSSNNFPVTSGVFQNSYAGYFDVVVTGLNASGTNLLFSTYLGGSNEDIGMGIYLDALNNIYLTGYTNSNNFDVTTGAFQTTPGGNYDVFVTKMNNNGSSLIYSTYVGGSQSDYGNDIKVDQYGYAYVTGHTFSNNFDVTTSVYQSTPGGGADAFLTKLNMTGNSLVFSTYLGGSADDIANALEIDDAGLPVIVGVTNSANFDITSDAYQSTVKGLYDVFITKFNTTGSDLVYSTYFGGSDLDYVYDIMFDSLSHIIFAGETRSTDFPITQGAFQTTKDNGYDIYLTRLDPSGHQVLYSTYLGGNSDDYGRAVQKGPGYSVYIFGHSNSTNYDITPINYQNLPQGLSELVFTRLRPCSDINLTITSNSPLCLGDTLTIQASYLNGYDYSWLCPDNVVIHDTMILIPGADTSYSGTYFLTITDSLGACSYLYQTQVQVIAPPQIQILIPEDSFCLGSSLQFSASDLSMSSYEWYGPEGFQSNEKEPTVTLTTYQHAGMYYLYVTNSYGCVGVDSVEIYVIDCTVLPDFNISSHLYAVPNPAFKVFTIYTAYPCEINIFNEEGKLIKHFFIMDKQQVSLPKGLYRIVRENDKKSFWILIED